MDLIPETPRTPPWPIHNQLPDTPSPPHSQTTGSLGSREYHYESIDPALQLEWSTHSATGIPSEAMLKDLFPDAPPSPNEAISRELRLHLQEVLSMRPEVVQYEPIADICNEILAEYYESKPPIDERPARWFIPLGQSILESDFAQRKPDIVVVLCSSWEEHVRTQLDEIPIAERRRSKEWKEEFPDWLDVDPHTRNCLTNPSSLHAKHLTPRLLRALKIHPPWECIVSVVEFKVSNTPDSTASASTPTSSNGTLVSDIHPKAAPKLGGSSPKAHTGKSPARNWPPPVSDRGSTPLVSKVTGSSQNSGAKHSSTYSIASRKTLSPEAQLLRYFCEVMSSRRYRDWTSGAIISGMDFSLVTCDREGAIKSTPTSLRAVDGVDTFTRWVLAVGSGTLSEAGVSNAFGQPDGQIEGATFGVPGYAKRASEGSIQLKFGKQHYQQYGAFGRNTTLYCVDVIMGNKNIPGVCKISWPAATRDSEYDLIQQARQVDSTHLPSVICAWDVEGSVLPSRTLRSQCPQPAVKHERRILRIIVFPFYGPIHELEGEEFFAAFWDVMMCNVRLYEANCVHHRDPSVNNMMYHRGEDGRVVGILTDFDLAVSMTGSTKPSSLHRGGTAPFMAVELLRSDACEQQLSHDFESALYILLWVALGYKGWKPPAGDPLSDWRRGTWVQIRNAKCLFINADLEEDETNFLGLIAPRYQVLRHKISVLHMNIQERVQDEVRAKAAERNGFQKAFTGPMTCQEFFNILGPPPTGREPFSEFKCDRGPEA